MPTKTEENLFQLLDNIDTLSDQIKPFNLSGYKAFYEAVLEEAKKRFNYLTTDGYTLSNFKSWVSIEQSLPEDGEEVLLHNEKWMDLDFNPEGIRVGFVNDGERWISASWNDYQDTYHTRLSEEDNNDFELFKGKDQIPTHWCKIPKLDI